MKMEKEVLLLAIYKKEDEETFQDILKKLEAARVFTFKEGKRLLKQLKEEEFLGGDTLTLKGLSEGKRVEESFKL